MHSVKYFLLASLALAALAGLGAYQAAGDKPLEIEAIMEKAHKGKPSLYKTVVEGRGNKDQKEELVKLYSDLGKNEPPKGSKEDWKKRTDKLVDAAKSVVADKPGSLVALKQAANCANCHDAHKSD
jgi:hypothetical protein